MLDIYIYYRRDFTKLLNRNAIFRIHNQFENYSNKISDKCIYILNKSYSKEEEDQGGFQDTTTAQSYFLGQNKSYFLLFNINNIEIVHEKYRWLYDNRIREDIVNIFHVLFLYY